MRLMSSNIEAAPRVKTVVNKSFSEKETDWGFSKLISLKALVDPLNGYTDQQHKKVTLVVEFT